MERIIRREKMEMLGIDPEDLRSVLRISQGFVDTLPYDHPLHQWHKKRLDYWKNMFVSIRMMDQDEPISGTEDL